MNHMPPPPNGSSREKHNEIIVCPIPQVLMESPDI
ncbi:hypothetical protein CBNA_1633 [Coxiella burnetii str. Namibia]|nr:hypothetical protein CBNA_1633 [Coxiella burnetii str. Namibia]